MEEEVSLKLDREKSAKICKWLLEPFDQRPIEEFRTILDAFTMATMVIAGQMKADCHSPMEDAIERTVLDTMCRAEKGGNLNFSKYINLPKEDGTGE